MSKNKQPKNTQYPPNQKLNSIQMFRGIAALMVIVFHFRAVLPIGDSGVLWNLVMHGYSGVDVFFVVSGFIAYYTISNSSQNESHQCLYYFLKRIIKIIPLYYIFTFLSAGHSLDSFYQTLKSLAFIPLGLGREGPIYGGARVSQGWTLNYEMYFYLVISSSLLFGRFKWWFTSITMVSFILAPIIIYGKPQNYNFEGFNFDFTYLSMVTNPVNIEFLLGVSVGYVHSRMRVKSSILNIFLIALSSVYFLNNYYSPLFFSSRVTAWGIPAALIILAFLKLEKSYKIVIPSFLIKTGNRSFSLYLVHAGIIGLITKIADHTSHKNVRDYSTFTGLVLFIVAFAITWIISGVTYKYIELYVSGKLRKWVLSRPIFSKKTHSLNSSSVF